MFQTFTGNSRRPRQVNLSGRTNNPFAATQSSSSGKAPPGGGGAIAHAQLERKARQQERDRLQASKRLQRVWRGHAARTEVRRQYLAILAESEQKLSTTPPSQRSFADVWRHLRLCVQAVRPYFQEDHSGIQRLLTAGEWICGKEEEVLAACRAASGRGQVIAPLRALIRLLLRFLNAMLFRSSRVKSTTFSGNDEQKIHVKRALALLAATLQVMMLVPVEDLPRLRSGLKEIRATDLVGDDVLAVEQYYRILGRASQTKLLPTPEDVFETEICRIVVRAGSHSATEQSSDQSQMRNQFTQGLLLAPGGIDKHESSAYEALMTGLLTRPELSADLLLQCRDILDIELYLKLARHLLGDKGGGGPRNHVEHQALLANTIYLCNSGPAETSSGSQPSTGSRADAISSNLSFLSILTRGLQNYDSVGDLDMATQEQLRRLVRPENISALFNRTDWISTKEGLEDDAQVLADYILTIIRLLPSQADEVRMWIYLSNSQDVKDSARSGQSAIRLFWAAVSQSTVFRRCCSSSREATELLPENRRAARPTSGASKASSWNIILLFLELYSFALRIQDDEQLVSGLKSELNGGQSGTSTLNLEEMKQLVTFLKNISYAIYTERTVILDDTPSGPSLAEHMNGFQGSWVPGEPSTSRPNAASTSGRISMSQLKGTATALLRMIYERDSRRNFLPSRHFIMEQFESSTFIADVLREQELKAHLEEEAENDSDEDTEMTDWDDRHPADREIMISSRTQQVQRQTRRAELQRQQARRSALQRAAPRVEVLENIPFLVPFETRIQIFRQQVEIDMYHRRGGEIDPDRWRLALAARNPSEATRELGAHSAELRRDHVFEDAFKAFDRLGEGLKEPIKISFIGEEGIDGGGVTKEFLTSIIDEVFSVDSTHHLFVENDQHELYPYPSALDEVDVYYRSAAKAGHQFDQKTIDQTKREKLQFYRFVGRVVGKCLYEGILVHIPLARFFIAKWALTGGDGASPNESTFKPSINDLWDYDQDIYRSMLQIKNYPGDTKELGIDFTVTDDIGGGERVERELKPGGSNIPVDNANRLIYIASITKHYLVDRQGRQTRAFLEGLSSIIRPTWLRMFNEAEIRTLLGGEATPIDVEDLRRNTVYGGVYQIGHDGKEHPTIKMFWEVMHEMQDSDRRKLLQYTTSTPNAPLMGFSHLNPRFSIRDSMSDQGRLPTSSTCANLLKLPIYRSKDVLRDKIMTAIHSGAGFDLS